MASDDVEGAWGSLTREASGLDVVHDVAFREAPSLLCDSPGDWLRVVADCFSDCGCHFVVAGVGKADVQCRELVVFRQLHGSIDRFEYIRFHQ